MKSVWGNCGSWLIVVKWEPTRRKLQFLCLTLFAEVTLLSLTAINWSLIGTQEALVRCLYHFATWALFKVQRSDKLGGAPLWKKRQKIPTWLDNKPACFSFILGDIPTIWDPAPQRSNSWENEPFHSFSYRQCLHHPLYVSVQGFFLILLTGEGK